MEQNLPTEFFALIAGIFFLGIIAAGFVLLKGPALLAKQNFTDKEQLDKEEVYRKSLSQMFGFPVILIGVAGGILTTIQALQTYRQSTELAYQEQYRHAYEALASDRIATRIGGLYILQELIERLDNSKDGGKQISEERQQTIFRSLSAYAVSNTAKKENAVTNLAKKDDLAPADASIALEILAKRKIGYNSRLDLRFGNFRGAKLGCEFDNCGNFSYSDLSNIDLRGSDLYKAKFKQSNLRFGNFSGSNMVGVDFSESGIGGAKFCSDLNYAVPFLRYEYPVRAQLNDANFNNASGEGAYFTYGMMQGSHFESTNLVKPHFDGAIFQNSHIKGSTFQDATFVDADMRGTEFSSSSLKGSANFRGAKLGGVTFWGTELENPDFTGANLVDVHFEGAKLRNPIFKNTIVNKNNPFLKNIQTETRGAFVLCDNSDASLPSCEKPQDLPTNPPTTEQLCVYASEPAARGR